MEKLKNSFKSLSPDHHHPEEEHQILLNQTEKNPYLYMNTSKPKDFVLEKNNKETELSISPKPHFNKNDSNTSDDIISTLGNSNKDLNFAEVSPCSQSSSSSSRKKSSLLVNRTKSRLMDPPEQDQRSQNVAMKSGVLLKDSKIEEEEEEEEDPFSGEDLPEEYKKVKFSTLTVLQLVSLVVIIAALVCSVIFRVLREKKAFGLELWKWEVMILVLICGRLFSGCVIRLVVFLVELNFLLRKRVLYFVYGLRTSVQNCIWLSLVLIAWQCIFNNKVDKMTGGKVLPYVSSIWICLLVGTYIWLLKTILVKVLAMSFHVSAFFDRIRESLFNQYVIETLSGPALVEIDQPEHEEEEKGTPRKTPMSATPRSSAFSRVISEKEKGEKGGITIDHLHRLNQKNISAWNMKRLINMVRNGVLSTLDEKLLESTHEDESAVQITSEKKAKAAAQQIFSNVAKPGSKFIYLEDLMRFLREDEALKTVRLIEGGTETGGISKRALKNWAVNAFRERRALALSLNDTNTAVNKLHQMLNVLVAIIIIIIWLLIFRVATTHFLVFLSSQMLLVVFIFGNSAKTTFEAIIFLFVMHPFDVGDRVEVDGVQMVVEEMNILTTVFLRYDNQKIIYPNSVLSTKPVSNYYRSPHMGDAVDFCIHISTPTQKIAMMKERITRYIENRSDHWQPAPMIVMRDVEDLNGIKWSVWLSHTMNHQDMGERWARRALLVEEMVKIFRELDIQYRMLPLDVNIRHLPQLSSSRAPSNWTVSA
ncbi:mechanosensitive ion channel protein 6-like [Lycium barbarum]|uniref:mechanosensitive ion channel protein 6-like n=1 Tax=Lycium barbarum TaxID=112863 RepID=UPI00293F4FFB|nr:mechanosensitive ion channel protein 6-like [Lycium barbarum]